MFVLGPHSMVLRGYTWLGAHWSLLAAIEDQAISGGIEPKPHASRTCSLAYWTLSNSQPFLHFPVTEDYTPNLRSLSSQHSIQVSLAVTRNTRTHFPAVLCHVWTTSSWTRVYISCVKDMQVSQHYFSVGHESGHRCQVNIRMWLWSSKTLFYKVSDRWFALELIPGWDCYFRLLPQAPLLSSPFITGLIFNLLRTGHNRPISADFPASTIAFTWAPIG